MRKIKRISLALVILPLLHTGCTQEKISTITPSKSTNKSIALDTDENNKTTANQILLDIGIDDRSHYEPIVQNEQTLEELANSIQNEMDTEITGVAGTFSKTVEVTNDWEELTKEDEIVETAKEFMGIKYIWAANGPTAFDCSGFTKYVFKQNGITLPRYSGHQAKVGTKVAYDELQKGDLVFFDTEKRYKGKVNHVGIYIGNEKFIHASSAKKKVIITSFKEKPFYKRRFLQGERVVNSTGTYASL